MVKRELVWEVSQDGMSIVPATPQDGGVQGDHNVTRAIFKVAEGSAWADPANAVYIECEDGAGNIDATEQLPVVDGKVSYLLPRAWTQYGGTVTLRLVAEGPGVEGALAYSPYATARFESRQNAMHKVDGLMKGRLAHMEQQMTEQMERAETAADGAAESARQATVQREGAQIHAEQAKTAAKQAEEEKKNAGAAASAAGESSLAAANSATAAELAADRAEDAAKTIYDAREVAGNAASSAVTAASAAGNAATQATTAAQKAEDARNEAVDAKTVAGNAANAAERHSATAGTAKQAAEQAAASAAISANAAQNAATGTVRFTEQELTDEQKAQARRNIGAGLPLLRFTVTNQDGVWKPSKTFQELSDAYAEGATLICVYENTELPLSVKMPTSFSFAIDVGGTQKLVIIYDNDDIPAAAKTFYPSIKIGDQMWGGEDDEFKVDFTDTINGMIADSLDIINAREYGAKGDGETDDTKAIQKALHAAEDKGLPLYIPAGNYLVSKTISTYTSETEEEKAKRSNSLNIFGSGMNTTFTTTDTFDGEYVFNIEVGSAQPRMLWVHDFNLELKADVSGIYFPHIGMKGLVENLWIKHHLKEHAAVRTGIYCDACTVATFRNIKVFGTYPDPDHMCAGLTLVGHSVKIIDCDVVFCKWGLYLSGGSNWVIDNCRLDENEYGVYQNSSNDMYQDGNAYKFKGSFKNLTIKGNRFEHNRKYGIVLISYGVGYLSNNNITIANNYFTGLGAEAVEGGETLYRRAVDLGRCDGVAINENYFNGASGGDQRQNFTIEGSVTNVSLKGNVASLHSDGTKTYAGVGNSMVQHMGFVDNIEMTQTTERATVGVRGNKRLLIETGGTIDVTYSNVFSVNDGVEVTGLKTSFGDVYYAQEVTLVANGAVAVKNTATLRLNGGVDFAMQTCDTLTLVKLWVNNGTRWVEKSRSVNRATTVAEEG